MKQGADASDVLKALKVALATAPKSFFDAGGQVTVYAYRSMAEAKVSGIGGWVGFLEAGREHSTIRIQPALRPATEDEETFFMTCPPAFRQILWKRFNALEKQARDEAAAKYPKMGDAADRLRYQASRHGALVDVFKRHYDLKDWQLEFILIEAATAAWLADRIDDPAA